MPNCKNVCSQILSALYLERNLRIANLGTIECFVYGVRKIIGRSETASSRQVDTISMKVDLMKRAKKSSGKRVFLTVRIISVQIFDGPTCLV